MKHIMVIAILASLFSGLAFAEETTTECPMMKELNERTNPKASSEDVKVKDASVKSSVSAQ